MKLTVNPTVEEKVLSEAWFRKDNLDGLLDALGDFEKALDDEDFLHDEDYADKNDDIKEVHNLKKKVIRLLNIGKKKGFKFNKKQKSRWIVAKEKLKIYEIIAKPYSREAEKKLRKLKALVAPKAIAAWSKGEYGKERDTWDEAGDFWVSTGLIDTPDDLGHLLLDFIGMVPVVGEAADLANAIWYFKEGRPLLGGLSLFSMIPIVGWAGAALKKAVKLGTPVSAKVALALIKQMPTFARIVTDLVSKSTRVQKLLPNGAGPVIAAVKGFLTKAGKNTVPEAIPGAGKKLMGKAAEDAAKETAEMVMKKTGRTLKKATGKAGDVAYTAALKKGSKEGLGVGATLASAKAARETAIATMEREAKKVDNLVYLIKRNTVKGKQFFKRGGVKTSLADVQAELAEAVFKAGGDYRALNIALKQAGLKGSAKTFVKATKEITGPAAKEFLELAAIAEKRGMMVGGKRVANNYWKKYSIRQVKRSGLLVVKYNWLTHQVGGSSFEDDPLSGVKRKATGSKAPGGDIAGRGCSAKLLKRGCSGKLVEKLQIRLQQLKYNVGAKGADGKYGKDTAAAVGAFQKATSGLKVDGVAGENTLAALYGTGVQKKAEVKAKLGGECIYSVDCERGLVCAGSGGRGSRKIGKCVSASGMEKAFAGSGAAASKTAAGTEGKIDTNIKTFVQRALKRGVSREAVMNIVKNYDPSLRGKKPNSAFDINTKLGKLKESNMNKVLANHKEQVLNERLEKLTKGLV